MSKAKKFLCFISVTLCLVSCNGRIYIDNEYYIEYMEMYASIGLTNGKQGFVGELEKAYWNSDSLVVSGNQGCFLIELGKTKYNDEMIELDCSNLASILKNKPIKRYLKGE